VPVSKEGDKKGRKNRGKEGRGGKIGREGENDLTHPLSQIPGYAIVA